MDGTDKEENGYLPTYRHIAADLGGYARVCELGVQRGGSLRLWQKLFPFGEVVGVDCDAQAVWPPGTRQVTRRQEDPELPAILGGQFGLIVDDASHLGAETMATFTNLWPLVAPGGYYVVEDWWTGLPEVIDAFAKVNSFHERYRGNESMLEMVQSLIRLLNSHDSECDEVTYRFGLAVAHKRRAP